jgi:hypothetical protein
MGAQTDNAPDVGRRQVGLPTPFFCLLSLLFCLLIPLLSNLPSTGSPYSVTLGQSQDYPRAPCDWRAAEMPAVPDRDTDLDPVCQADADDEVKDYHCLPVLQVPDCPPESHPLPCFILPQKKSQPYFQNPVSRSPPPLFRSA